MERKIVLEMKGDQKVMSVKEVADFLHVHPATIYRLLRTHEIPAFKIGTDWRFNRESIERWMEEREEKMR
jgi:excisionase family DNA binding protein